MVEVKRNTDLFLVHFLKKEILKMSSRLCARKLKKRRKINILEGYKISWQAIVLF
jgi:hypothetical protein